METTDPSKVAAALRSNREAQLAICRQIQCLAKKKAENRRLASVVAAQLSASWARIEKPSIEPRSTDATAENGKRKGYHITKWQYDPYRKWKRRFFVDPNGSIPSRNQDVVRRRTLEQDKFFFHSSPPWSKKEVAKLKSIVETLINDKSSSGEGTNDFGGNEMSNVDFDGVAKLMNEQNGASSTRRTAAECRVKYQNSLNTTCFNKDEKSRLSVLVSNNMNWKQIAGEIGNNRTAWQCFVAHQSSQRAKTKQWTPKEDELLLKYASAMGPQWVLHKGAAAKMSLQFFPEETPKQIMGRANTSLVNPNFVHSVWSDEEERKLVLCMKCYRDDPNPLMKSASHFPGRATRSVSDKWTRGLDPSLSSKPFSAEEDKALLEVVEKSSGSLDWIQIAKSFPGRQSRTLSNRWAELASHDDFIRLCMMHAGGEDSSASGAVNLEVRVKPT